MVVEYIPSYGLKMCNHTYLWLSKTLQVIQRLLIVQASAARAINSEVLDTKGCLVMPGFVNMHVHITGGAGEAGAAVCH
jgi:N-acetylglucosamine-6-phosphate deacetylase